MIYAGKTLVIAGESFFRNKYENPGSPIPHLQPLEKFHRGHHGQQGRLVVFDIARDQAIQLALDCHHHLHGIYEIRIVQVERLLEVTLVYGCNFDDLQHVGDGSTLRSPLPFWIR